MTAMIPVLRPFDQSPLERRGACTSGSFVYGWEGARQQVEAIAQATGVPASSTPFAFVDASRALGLSWPTTRGATLVWACSCDQAGSGTTIPSLEHGSVRSDTGSTREKIAGAPSPTKRSINVRKSLSLPPLYSHHWENDTSNQTE